MLAQSPFTSTAIQGRVAIITGGGSGIGLEIAKQLGLHGCKVAITGRRAQVLEASRAALSAEGVECMAIQGDVRSADACNRWVQAVVNKWSSLDVLVNCAAGNFLSTPEELTVNGFRTVMEIDAVGTFNMSRAAFPALKAAGHATIINISATLHYGASWYQILPGRAVGLEELMVLRTEGTSQLVHVGVGDMYTFAFVNRVHASAAKAAVDSITRSLALEWGEFGITVNGVAPGPIQDTEAMVKLAPGKKGDDLRAAVVKSVPAGRMGEKRDIAMACVFLASNAASFVSGHVLVVDGAHWMWRPQHVPREKVAMMSRQVETQRRGSGVERSKL